MSEVTTVDATSTETVKNTLHLPLLPKHPRLRFIDGAPEGAAGDPVETPPAEEEKPEPGEEALGDAGKKALDAMKAARNAAIQEAKDAKAELDRIRAEQAAQGKPEDAIEKVRREVTETITKETNQRILRAELKAAATGVLADPTEAAVFIDISKFDVDANGDVDSDAIRAAINTLIEKKPHLAAQKANPFAGGADGGAKLPPKPDPTFEEQLAAAKAAGDWRAQLALQNSKLPTAK